MLTEYKHSKGKPGGIILLGLILLLLCLSCTKKTTSDASSSSVSVKPQGRAYFDLFDTVSYIYSYKGDTEEEFLSNADEAYSVLLYYHELFDIYHEYEGVNNLCTINSNPLVKSKWMRHSSHFSSMRGICTIRQTVKWT